MPSEAARKAALARIDNAQRWFNITLFGAATVEAILLIGVLVVIDFHDRLHRLLFLLTALTYLTLSLGLVALGARMDRGFERIVAAIEGVRRREPDA